MKLRILFAALAVCISITACTTKKNTSPAPHSFEVLQPAPKEEVESIIQWINDNESAQRKFNDKAPPIDAMECYYIDINNDGIKEYIFAYKTNYTDEYRKYTIFAPTKDGFVELDMPSTIEGLTSDPIFHNLITDKDELFARINDKIYMLRDVGRNVYLWAGNSISECYDTRFAHEQRAYFNALRQQKKYRAAYEFMQTYEANSRQRIDPKVSRLLQQDLKDCAKKLGKSDADSKTFTHAIVTNAPFEVVQPAAKEVLTGIKQWLLTNKNKQDKSYWDASYETLAKACDGSDYHQWYIADINNDGINEYIVAYATGADDSWRQFVIFSKTADGFRKISAPATLEAQRLFSDFYNPLSGKKEFFARMNGKTYFIEGPGRNLLLWAQNRTTECLDKQLLEEQRAYFTELYRHKQYQMAYNFLQAYEENSRYRIDPQTSLWLRNDLALAVIRGHYPRAAQKMLAEIKKDPSFKNASPALKKAIATNESLCIDEIAKNVPGQKYPYNYQALLNSIKNDKWRAPQDYFEELLAITIPDAPFAGEWPSSGFHLLQKSKHPDEHQSIDVIDDRYITFRHYGGAHYTFPADTLVWCDTVEKISAIFDDKMVYSRTMDNIKEFPDALITALKMYYEMNIPANRYWGMDTIEEETFAPPTTLDFCDRNGKITTIAL